MQHVSGWKNRPVAGGLPAGGHIAQASQVAPASWGKGPSSRSAIHARTGGGSGLGSCQRGRWPRATAKRRARYPAAGRPTASRIFASWAAWSFQWYS